MAREVHNAFIVILLVLVSYSEAGSDYWLGKFGKLYSTCTSDDDCSYKNQPVPEMDCKDGRCECSEPRYTLFIKPDEAFFEDNGKIELLCKELKNEYFFVKQKEKELVCKDYSDEKHCLCPNGTHYIDRLVLNGCKNLALKGLSSSCDSFHSFCDFKRSLECVGGSCKCKRNMMYDFDEKICIQKSKYLEENNLTSYRVTYGVYCSSDSDCLEGLVCNDDFKCHCPRYCKYDKTRTACDCGEVGVDVAPIVVGVFGGFFIILFWCLMIRKSVLKHREKTVTITRVPLTPRDSTPAPSSVPGGQSSISTSAPLPYSLQNSSAPPSEISAAGQPASYPPPYSELPEFKNTAGPLPYPIATDSNSNLAYQTPSAPPDPMSGSPSAQANSIGTEKPDLPYPLVNANDSAPPVGFSSSQIDPPSYDDAVKGRKE